MSRFYPKGERKQYICGWRSCNTGFDQLSHLVHHLSEDHVGFKKEEYVCQWEGCARFGKIQASRFSLISHLRSHTGEKPYPCTFPNCNRDFTRSDSLAKHVKSHHPGYEDIQQKKQLLGRTIPQVVGSNRSGGQINTQRPSPLTQSNMSRSMGMDNMGYGGSGSRMMANDPRYFQANQLGRGDSNVNSYSQQAVQSYSRQGMTQGQKGNEFGNNNDSMRSGKIASAITSGSGEKIQKELNYEENCMIVSECIEFLNDEIEGYKEQIENKKNRIQQLKLQNYLTLEKLIKMKEKRRTLKLKLKMKNKLNMDVKKNKTKKRKS